MSLGLSPPRLRAGALNFDRLLSAELRLGEPLAECTRASLGYILPVRYAFHGVRGELEQILGPTSGRSGVLGSEAAFDLAFEELTSILENSSVLPRLQADAPSAHSERVSRSMYPGEYA